MKVKSIFFKKDTWGHLATNTPLKTNKIFTWLIMLSKKLTLITVFTKKEISYPTNKPQKARLQYALLYKIGYRTNNNACFQFVSSQLKQAQTHLWNIWFWFHDWCQQVTMAHRSQHEPMSWRIKQTFEIIVAKDDRWCV